MVKKGKFIWTQTHEESLQNVKFLCSLQVKNDEQSYSYIQKLDWTNYQNEVQPMTSEREFIVGALLSHSPDTALKLRTLSDIFKIKSKGGHYKTRAQNLLFLQRCHEQLSLLPYDAQEHQKIKQFIDDHSENLKLKKDVPAPVHYLKSAPIKSCACADCSQISHINVGSSLLDPYTARTSFEESRMSRFSRQNEITSDI